MDVLVIGTSDQLVKISGWLADDGHLVRRSASLLDCAYDDAARPLNALLWGYPPTQDEQASVAEWLVLRNHENPRLFFIGDAEISGWVALSAPFRRRVVLSTMLSSD